MTIDQRPILTADEICEICGFSRTAFHKLRKLGIFRPLPHIRRREKYPRQQIQDWIAMADKKETKP